MRMRFEDMETCELPRELACKVYGLTKKDKCRSSSLSRYARFSKAASEGMRPKERENEEVGP